MNGVSLLSFASIVGLIGMSSGTTNSFGVNGYYNGYYWYASGVCYPDTWGSSDDSDLYECDGSTLTYKNYDSRDCTGNASYSWDYSSYSGASCSSSYGDSDYLILMRYDDDSDCSETGSYYDVYKSEIVNKCINTTSSSGASSEYYTCSQNSWNLKSYSSVADCSGDHDWQYTYDAEYYSSWLSYDFKMYCSTAEAWSDCNENAAFTMNNKFIISFVAALMAAIFNQM